MILAQLNNYLHVIQSDYGETGKKEIYNASYVCFNSHFNVLLKFLHFSPQTITFLQTPIRSPPPMFHTTNDWCWCTHKELWMVVPWVVVAGFCHGEPGGSASLEMAGKKPSLLDTVELGPGVWTKNEQLGVSVCSRSHRGTGGDCLVYDEVAIDCCEKEAFYYCLLSSCTVRSFKC